MDSADILAEKIRNALKKQFNLTDEELDAAFDEGRLYPTAEGRGTNQPEDNNIIIIETPITYTKDNIKHGLSTNKGGTR